MSSIRDIYPAVRHVDDVDKETDEQCVRCKGNCGFIGITGMWACQGFIPLTNADRIRSMSDEELTDLLTAVAKKSAEMLCKSLKTVEVDLSECDFEILTKTFLSWLKSPVEVDE